MCLLVKVVILILHYERGVARAATALDHFVEWFLESTAYLDVPHSGRSIGARFIHLVSLLCIIAGDGPVGTHALFQHAILPMRSTIRVRGVTLPVRRVHLLEGLHVARELGGVHHRDIQIVASGASRALPRPVPSVSRDLNILVLK